MLGVSQVWSRWRRPTISTRSTSFRVSAKLLVQDEASFTAIWPESIRVHPDQETLSMMEQAGLERVEYFNLMLGVVALHRGFKF